jgi:CBS domain-containing protein
VAPAAQVNRLPVIAPGGALVGVLTRTDVVTALANAASSSQPI